MTHTFRTRLLHVHDGADAYHPGNADDHWGYHGSARDARRFFAKVSRRKQRRQHAKISREAMVEYYDDLAWIERFEAEIEARLAEEESAYGMLDLVWDMEEERRLEEETAEADMFDSLYDAWNGAAEYAWLDDQMGRYS